MVTFFFIRHGESKDNLRGVWAGWKDSPLSTHGLRQAQALADHFVDHNIFVSAIHSSDLIRTRTTAKTIQEKQLEHAQSSRSESPSHPVKHEEDLSPGLLPLPLPLPPPSIPLYESPHLREQHFGAGEGRRIAKKEKSMTLTAHYAQNVFPVLHTRDQRFPGGESLDDVAERAERVVDEILMPYVLEEREECGHGEREQGELKKADGEKKTGSTMGKRVAIVSHGLFIPELVKALVDRDPSARGNLDVRNLRGMKNTGWTRVEVALKVKQEEDNARPVLTTKVTGINKHVHLSNLHRQKGGIGSMAHDPAQTDIRAFLAGSAKSNGALKSECATAATVAVAATAGESKLRLKPETKPTLTSKVPQTKSAVGGRLGAKVKPY